MYLPYALESHVCELFLNLLSIRDLRLVTLMITSVFSSLRLRRLTVIHDQTFMTQACILLMNKLYKVELHTGSDHLHPIQSQCHISCNNSSFS